MAINKHGTMYAAVSDKVLTVSDQGKMNFDFPTGTAINYWITRTLMLIMLSRFDFY